MDEAGRVYYGNSAAGAQKRDVKSIRAIPGITSPVSIRQILIPMESKIANICTKGLLSIFKKILKNETIIEPPNKF